MASLTDLLLRSGDIEFDQVESVRSQQEYRGGRLEHILVENRMVAEKTLTDAISRVTQVPRAHLERVRPDPVAMTKLKGDYALETPVFPISWDETQRTLTVALTDPVDLALLDEVIQRAGCRVKPLVAGLEEIRKAVRLHYMGQSYEPDPNVPAGSGDEFKITDMSGRTLMTSMEQLKAQHDAQKAARAPAPAAPPPPPIDEMAQSLFQVDALSPDEMDRLKKVRINVEKSGLILRAIVDLLYEKGLLGPGDLPDR